MEEKQIAPIGSFCLNEVCEEYQKVNHGNMMKYGKTEKGVQRYRCQTCKKTFTQTKGTMFYRCRHSEEERVECMEMLGDRKSLAAIHRRKGVKNEHLCIHSYCTANQFLAPARSLDAASLSLVLT